MRKRETGNGKWETERRKAAAFFFFVSLFPFPVSRLYAAAGEAAFEFADFDRGARTASMAEAATAVSGDASGAPYNPAILSSLWRHQVSFLHADLFQGISYQSLQYAAPTRDRGSFGLSMMTVGYGDIPAYNGTGGAAGNVQTYDRMLEASYARPVTGRSAVGATIRHMEEKLGGVAGRGLGFDAGLLTRPWSEGFLSGVGLGFSARNLGGKAKFGRESADLSTSYRAGVACTAFMDTWTAALDVVKPAASDARISIGTEYWLRDALALRAGYRTDDDAGDGLRLGVGVRIRDWTLDYAFAGAGDAGAVHRIGLSFRFGSLAEVYYRQGIEKMNDGRFAEAIIEFDRALALDPRHERALLRIREAHAHLKEKLLKRSE